MTLCNTVSLNAWDRIGEVGGKTDSFAKFIQDPKETFINFLQRLTSAINKRMPNSEIRQVIIESLAFENANAQYKMVIRPLKDKISTLGGMDLRHKQY